MNTEGANSVSACAAARYCYPGILYLIVLAARMIFCPRRFDYAPR